MLKLFIVLSQIFEIILLIEYWRKAASLLVYLSIKIHLLILV